MSTNRSSFRRALIAGAVGWTVLLGVSGGVVAAGANRTWLCGVGVVWVSAGALTFMRIRALLSQVERISAGMSEAADQVASAAGQLSAASQSLARDVSAQAESLSSASGTSGLMA